MTSQPSHNARRVRPLSRRTLLARGGGLAALLGRCALASGTLLPVAAATGCNDVTDREAHQGDEPYTGSTFAFDTFCEFTVYEDEGAVAELGRLCSRYDSLFDLYDESSDVARINAAGGAPVEVDPDTAELIQAGIDWSSRSNGRFDITIGAVSTLWDFTEGIRPTDDAITAALPHVNWENVRVNGTEVTLDDPEAKLDLGGIAKGFIADKLVEALRARGTQSALLSLGGNIVTLGSKPDGSAWNVGVRDPNEPGGTSTAVVTTVAVRDCSVVTSGLYESTFEIDGKRYWHILDPRTGYPVETDVASVTVISPTSTAGDALSTTLFVAGTQEGLELVNTYDDTGALFLDENNEQAPSALWKELGAQ